MSKKTKKRHIQVYYQTITPESAKDGDYADGGEEDIIDCEPDKYDIDEGITAVELAVEALRKGGATEPSSSQFHKKIWYSTPDAEENYRTGEMTYYTYHLHNFHESEELAVFMLMTGKKPKLYLV